MTGSSGRGVELASGIECIGRGTEPTHLVASEGVGVCALPTDRETDSGGVGTTFHEDAGVAEALPAEGSWLMS